MPTLVWISRPESGADAGGATSSRRAAAVSDQDVSAAAATTAPDDAAVSTVSTKRRIGGGTIPRKRRARADHPQCKRSNAKSERGLPTGVYKAWSGRFECSIKWGGKMRHIGTFDTPEQASAAFLSVRKDLDDVNLSAIGADEVGAMFDAAQKKAAETVGGVVPKKKKPRSERDLPRGVKKTRSGKFQAMIRWRGKLRHIGTFDSPEQASVAYLSMRRDRDKASLSVVGAEEADALFDAAKTKACGFVPKKELPQGVRKLPSGNYNAMTQWGGKSVYIGTFDTPEQASAVYLSVRKDLDIANLSAPADQVDDVFEAAKAKALKRAGAPVPKKKSKQMLKIESAAVSSSLTAADTIPTCSSSNHLGRG